MTDAERKLWFALKDRRFAAFKFRRQVPVGRYIADFLCFELRLIVEVDGGQHAESARDVERDDWFAQNEFRVVRFCNNDVLQNLEGVLTSLNTTPHLSSSLRPTPPSPARGEGKKSYV
jgi:very-short-patch-repair endonuclease